MKEKFLKLYMSVAEEFAKNSYAERLKVGAIAVKDHRILSCGYNGTPPGDDNSCENKVWVSSDRRDWDDPGHYELVTKPEVIHAEMNLIYKLARDGQSALGADLFLTHSPCFECAKAIKSVGFAKVWYRNRYRSDEGIVFLRTRGIMVEQI